MTETSHTNLAPGDVVGVRGVHEVDGVASRDVRGGGATRAITEGEIPRAGASASTRTFPVSAAFSAVVTTAGTYMRTRLDLERRGESRHHESKSQGEGC